MESSIRTITLESEPITYLCAVDAQLGQIIKEIGTLEYKTHSDGYVFLIHEIVEQMLSKKVGEVIFNRIVTLCGGVITPESVLNQTIESIRACGVSAAKAEYIFLTSKAVYDGQLNLKKLASLPDESVVKILTSIRGIGPWTAKMYLIFVLDRLDVLPYEDGAFLQVYKWMYKPKTTEKDSIVKQCEIWHPYSSIAARYMYRALDSGMTKK